jgi:hypothetical protein
MPQNPVAPLVEREPVPAVPTPASVTEQSPKCVAREVAAPPIEKSANAAAPGPLKAMAQDLVRELMPLHPTPGNAALAVPIVERILAAAKDAKAEVERIRRNHASWRDYWNLRGPGFVRMLFGWFQQGDWAYDATAGLKNLRKPPGRAAPSPFVTPTVVCEQCSNSGWTTEDTAAGSYAKRCSCKREVA